MSLLESELNDIETIVYADLRKLVERMKVDQEEACDCGKWYLKHWVSELEELYDGGE